MFEVYSLVVFKLYILYYYDNNVNILKMDNILLLFLCREFMFASFLLLHSIFIQGSAFSPTLSLRGIFLHDI